MNGRPCSHTGAKQWGDTFHIRIFRYLDSEGLAYYNVVGIASHSRLVVMVTVYAVVCKRSPVLAELLLIHFAKRAMPT